MAFNIKNDRADELLRELTALTGESLTDAITESLRQRLERERRLASHIRPDGTDSLRAAIERLRSHRVADIRTDDEVIGDDEHGLPA
ncbi:MAG: type II toxin-antitoxin system VapB family antitoxin [Ilumatobacter sp.]|uniref:type II toxin-antitoxin system VapB family antitoxin n=1 Tax=Ilumatobacter sp. TaxID=1967498 RepID=UPI00260620D2|nr:type II toxin-antitoxin system VapB family antitoxin [Ilumatobacter sp.]MDJ0769504.1 type II toxin-antitoxin system VapB family antitoxin [Ilumatobacter sp.]